MKVIIVGAGIGGLSAAIGLRRAGHDITILEKSTLNNEIGAAIHVPPNATRILSSWSFSPSRARFVSSGKQIYADGETLIVDHENKWEKGSIEREFGADFWLAHRVDLHAELKLLATGEEGVGMRVRIETGCEVVCYDAEKGIVTLADGTTRTGDLIVAADGIHSQAVKYVVGYDNPAQKTGFAIFRFLLPTEAILEDEKTRHFMEEGDGVTRIYEDNGNRRIIWYPCRAGRIQNFGFLVPERDGLNAQEGWNIDVDKEILLHEGRNYHPSIQAVLRKADDIKLWALLSRDPLPTWHKCRLVVIGDAAHPMLPSQAQAGAQAISDGAALGILFSNFNKTDADSICARLKMFENVRFNRATVMQKFSDMEFKGQEAMRDAARPYMSGEEPPLTRAEQVRYRFKQNVFEDCKKELEKATVWSGPDH